MGKKAEEIILLKFTLEIVFASEEMPSKSYLEGIAVVNIYQHEADSDSPEQSAYIGQYFVNLLKSSIVGASHPRFEERKHAIDFSFGTDGVRIFQSELTHQPSSVYLHI